jgi:uncharacterized protein YcfJ
MDRHDDDMELHQDVDSSTVRDGETHASTGGAAAAGAVTGGVIGLTGGPVGAAIGAVGGAIVGAAAERLMHSDDDAERASMPATTATYTNEYTTPTRDVPVDTTDVTLEHPLMEGTPIERRPSDMSGTMTGERTSDSSRLEEDARVEQRPG